MTQKLPGTFKLTDDEVAEIRRELKRGVTQVELAERFNTTQPNISYIKNFVNRTLPAEQAVKRAGRVERSCELSRSDVLKVRQLLRYGWHVKAIAERFDVAATSITNINHGRSYAWLDDEGHHVRDRTPPETYGFYTLTKSQAREIKDLLRDGLPAKTIAKDFRVSRQVVYNIKRGRTWKGA